MFNCQLETHSAAELATHVIPEFYPLTLLVQSETDLPHVGGVASLSLKCSDLSFGWIQLNINVALSFDVDALNNWFAVTVSPDQQALIHQICYLCRHHTDDYGKLFRQLITDFSLSQ